ncbi:MAG: hypothetical protein K2P92_07795, partial [Bdellovibrionaceae bacterium]|nr:hypothetical protein [Pseudobdellovibrionaceae bacterium]
PSYETKDWREELIKNGSVFFPTGMDAKKEEILVRSNTDEFKKSGDVTVKNGEYYARHKMSGRDALHHIEDKELGKKLLDKKIKFHINENDDAVDVVESNMTEAAKEKWVIKDWAGNYPFEPGGGRQGSGHMFKPSKTFKSFDEADQFLDTFLEKQYKGLSEEERDKKYEEDRGEYYIDPVEANVTATGEPDGDYDVQAFDAICKKLKAAGYMCKHKEFDKYQGPFIQVGKNAKKLATFWVKDYYTTGDIKPDGAKYRSATLMGEDGSESSANAGDYFMMGDNEVFEGSTLILVGLDGKEQVIENPKKKDLPDLLDVRNSFQYEGKPDEHIVFYDEDHGDELDFTVTIPKGDYNETNVGELLDYLEVKTAENVTTSVTASKKKSGKAKAAPDEAQPVSTEPKTYGAALQDLKAIYADAEKVIKRLSDFVESEAILQVNYDMSEGFEENDKKIGGQDVEAPYFVKENPISSEGAYGRGYIMDEASASKALLQLAQMYPDVSKFIHDGDNVYVSWGATSGMMPNHHANYPKDAVLIRIEGVDTEEFMQRDLSLLADVAKKKNDETFKKFLQ